MADEIYIARHIGPDPDAIASQTALRDTIKATYKNKKVLAVGTSVSKFKYFGELDKIGEPNYEKAILIVLDVPNISRVDVDDYAKFKQVIKIDHHPYEDKMGKIEWVDETASSTCQLIIELILNSSLRLTEEVARNLFLGVVSDSDRFLLPYTTTKTFELITQLIQKSHLDFTKYYPLLYERPINEIKFHGYLSQNLTLLDSGLAYLKLDNKIINEFNVDHATASNMINDFNFIKEVLVWLFVTYDERTNIYKVNIRSRGPVINEIASLYGGGGHKFASGVRTDKEEDIDKLINALDKACQEYKK